MCKCHKFNRETNRIERLAGKTTLETILIGEKFYFPHEGARSVRVCVAKRLDDYYCPLVNGTGLSERGEDVFHRTARIIALAPIDIVNAW